VVTAGVATAAGKDHYVTFMSQIITFVSRVVTGSHFLVRAY